MVSRTLTAIEVRSKLKFKQHDLIITKELSVLTKIMNLFATEKILMQHSVSSYKIDCNLLKANQVDKKSQKERNEDKEIDIKRAIEKELICKFIRINLDEKRLICMLKLLKYTITLINHLKNLLQTRF